jgi:cell wall-associated NlpC family hydrolase
VSPTAGTGGLADQIDDLLESRGSPMAGLGSTFVAVGQKYGVDPRLLVGISGIESGFGVHTMGANNAWGWGPGKPFSSWEQGMSTVAQGLKAGYLNQGLTTPIQIANKYAPASDGNDPANWANVVSGFITKLGGNPETVRVAGASPSKAGVPTTPTGPSSLSPSSASTLPQDYFLGQAAFQNLGEIARTGHADPVSELQNMSQGAAMDQMYADQGMEQLGPAENIRVTTNGGKNVTVVSGVKQGSAVAQNAVALIKRYLGTPYKWGGASPGGFDCSGLLQYVWGKEGVNIPRTTYQQWTAGTAVPANQLQPGDAVFFTGSDPQGNLPGHVGMYIGNGQIIEAPHTGTNVQIDSLASHTDFVGARRFA